MIEFPDDGKIEGIVTIPYGKQCITSDDIAAVVEILEGEYLTQGPAVADFELAFAEAIGSRYAVAVANGTGALHLACIALGVKPGSRVLTTPITFAASANCVRYCGGTVEFVDIDPSTRCIDLSLLEEVLAGSPRGHYSGVIPVDFGGYPVDLGRLRELANRYSLWVLEDACHALGGSYSTNGGSARNCGANQDTDAAIFSFHPVKHITTGEGGMITTQSGELYNQLRALRTHGIVRDPALMNENHGRWYYEMQTLGYNYRMPDILAALGKSQLRRHKEMHYRRQAIAARYDSELAFLPMTLPTRPHGGEHAFHLYVIETDYRDALYQHLLDNDIACQVHYIPVNHMPYYRGLGYSPEQTPKALHYYTRALSLPMYPSLTDEEQSMVIDVLKKFQFVDSSRG